MSGINSLVSTNWLADNISNKNIRVIDASWHLPNSPRNAKNEFAEDHLDGAIFFDIDENSDLDNPLPHMMPSNEKMSATVKSMGINNDSHIIVYDNSDFCTSARVWFMFKNFGHENISILDGGFKKWKSEGHPTSNKTTQFEPSHYRAKLDENKIRSMKQVTDNIGHKQEQLIDARAAGRFLGTVAEPRPGSKSGHIPGSFNIPFTELLNENLTYKSSEDIKNIFEKTGIDLTKPIITSCGSGVTACILIFALQQIGHRQNALYDGSWSEWGTHPDTTVIK